MKEALIMLYHLACPQALRFVFLGKQRVWKDLGELQKDVGGVGGASLFYLLQFPTHAAVKTKSLWAGYPPSGIKKHFSLV